MELPGLKINDPDKEQYQLWIFEKGDLEPHPIDGGVFDITGSDDVIEIEAKILARAKYFAVTVEKPGGVVVSDRSRIATVGENLAAKLAGGK
jgi:anti-sigma-K factor RskA